MFRKNYFTFLLAVSFILSGVIFASAQIVNITGSVMMTKEDGTKEAVPGALVEIYNTGKSSGLRSDKTDKKGGFSFVGVPPGAEFLVSVSGEGLEPVIVPMKAGMENQVITVNPGDGTHYTEEQVRAAPSNAGGGGGGLSEDDKKKQEELEKKIAETKAKNERIKNANAIIDKSIKEGTAAFEAKNYDLAITKFNEGYEVTEDYIGSAPVFLNNVAISHRLRAVDNFNASVKSSDAAEKSELKKKAASDFQESLAAYAKALTISNGNNDEAKVAPEIIKKAKADAADGGTKVVGYMVQTQLVDASKAEDAKLLVNEFVATQSDKDAKIKAQVNLGKYLVAAGDADSAVATYRKALETDAGNSDVLAGLGLALFTAGEGSGNVEQKQEGLNYMQLYLDKAPKDHSDRESIEGVVEYLKTQNMKPKKIK